MKRGILLFVTLVALTGCASQQLVKNQPSAGNTPVQQAPATGPAAPSLVDLHPVVSDQDYQAAVSEAGNAEVNRHNVESYLTIAQYQYNRSEFGLALKIYQKILAVTSPLPESDKAQYMAGQVHYEKKDYLPALSAFQGVLQKYPKSVYVDQSRKMMEFILTYSLGLDDLKSFVANYPDSSMNCFALFQLGSHEAQAGMQAEAVEHLNSFAQQCPQHPSASAAQLLLESLHNQQQGKSWKIGVLVPKTGRYKSFGESVLNGVTLAMEQANQTGGTRKPMSVLVRDTQGDPIAAVSKFQELSKDGALDAIIGPVVPNEIAVVAPQANLQKITLICPSGSRDGLSTLGPYIFSNSMTNEMQGRAMAKYAIEKLGFKRFGILAPDDGYGETLSDAFQSTVEAMGGTVTARETYAPASTDFKKQLLAMGGQDPTSTKDNDRENNRKLDELKYNIKKEVGKILLKSRDTLGDSAVSPSAIPVAFVPLVEGLTNTTCPSVARDINAAIRSNFEGQPNYQMRKDDLVQQSMTRMPVEFKGNTVPVSAEHWAEIAQDAQATLLVTGRIVSTNPPGDWSAHPTWDFIVTFEAYQALPNGTFSQIYRKSLPYSIFKPSALVRSSTNMQALYLPAHAVEVSLITSQVHFYDLNPIFLGGHLWESPNVLQEGTKDVEGSYFVTGFYVDSAQGNARKFADDYLKRFAKRPDLLAAQAYDAARLLLKATETAAGRDDIRSNLMGIRDFDGVTGKTDFGGRGEANKIVPVLKIQGGKYQQVQ